MFGLFKSKKSPVRQRIEDLLGVRGTWNEWTIENGTREPTLVVEWEHDLDPASPNFDVDCFARVVAAANATEAGEAAPPRLRIVPSHAHG